MKKRVLFDIGHPAQVHQFKYVYNELSTNGWEGLFSAKEKEVSVYLLKAYKLPYINLGAPKKGLVQKIMQLPITLWRFLKVIDHFKPDLIISRFSPHASWGAFIKNIPHIGLTDTEHVGFIDNITVPFVSVKLTSVSYWKNLGRNHFRYPGNIELFYLHPKYFKPDFSIFSDLNLPAGTPYVIVRFISWEAYHDVGSKGFSLSQKIKLIQDLSMTCRVYISSEKNLPVELEPYRINFAPERMHDALAFAALYIGEGGTMASEAACLGTPSIFINSLSMGYIEEEASHGLLYNFRNAEEAHKKAIEILSSPDYRNEAQSRLALFLESKIDSTSFLIWVIEHYPQSIETLKRDPHFPEKFRIKKQNQ